ncbi:MAG TPA: enoyl-CoA hydratase-related protein [Acidimicrobiia bacterium]|nr:enoyl-CoA hydratase-related protein [Acidimicrobiia bacterium]
METSTEPVLYAVAEGVATLTLNNPERKNAWNLAMEQRYFELLDEAAASPAVRAIVVTGAGSSFCPGMDMTALAGTAEAGELVREGRRPMHSAMAVPKPMIAAINGACAGIGLIQAVYCDVRFAARGARMSTSFTRRGLGAEYGMSWMIPRLVGVERALDLLLSGRVFDAEEAHAIGLVSRLCEPGDVLAEAQAYACELARYSSPRGMAAVRHQVYADLGDDFDRSWARALRIMHRMAGEPDFGEGIASFTEKRDPRFEALPAGFADWLVLGPGDGP